MNKKITTGYRNALNEIRIASRSHINCVRFFKNNTKAHEMSKAKLCFILLKQDRDFITEAIFNNGKRGDVVCLEKGVCLEVLETETLEDFNKKRETYPEFFEVVPLFAKDILKEDFILEE